ncbi:programmed cell death protein 4-like [Manduca sexta]|uniref:programmed cell death protein 4-like n=1 Tax=Manduca sexta TaxID=7130 RepID=UPI001890204C|nr:programmed cell death protein 4-like [Manduca sexta]
MEVERNASDSENVAADEKPVGDEGAGDATTSHSDKLRRKNKKYARSNSKEGVTVVAPLPKYRSWKNSRRPRNGHGRGLPKKGGAGGKGVWGAPGSELLEEYVEDANDPNYDSEAVTNGDVEFKQVIVEADPEEVVVSTMLEVFYRHKKWLSIIKIKKNDTYFLFDYEYVFNSILKKQLRLSSL